MVVTKLRIRDLKPGCKIVLPYNGCVVVAPLFREESTMPHALAGDKVTFLIYSDQDCLKKGETLIKGIVTYIREEILEWDWTWRPSKWERRPPFNRKQQKIHTKTRYSVLRAEDGREIYYERCLMTNHPFKRVVEDTCPCCGQAIL